MTEQAKQAKRAYQKQWQRNNRDKVKAYQETYWARRAAAAAAANAENESPAAND